MLRRLHLLLMVCVAVALPVQGMASVTMTHCGPGHHGAPGSQRAASDGHPADHHAAAPDSPGGDHHAVPSNAASASDTGDGQPLKFASSTDAQPAKAGKAGAATKVSCSACASCCLGAGMTAPQAMLPSLPGADAALAVPEEAAPAGVTVGGLERPPRLNLA